MEEHFVCFSPIQPPPNPPPAFSNLPTLGHKCELWRRRQQCHFALNEVVVQMSGSDSVPRVTAALRVKSAFPVLTWFDTGGSHPPYEKPQQLSRDFSIFCFGWLIMHLWLTGLSWNESEKLLQCISGLDQPSCLQCNMGWKSKEGKAAFCTCAARDFFLCVCVCDLFMLLHYGSGFLLLINTYLDSGRITSERPPMNSLMWHLHNTIEGKQNKTHKHVLSKRPGSESSSFKANKRGANMNPFYGAS